MRDPDWSSGCSASDLVFAPHLLKRVVKEKASRPLHVLGLSKRGHATHKICLLQ